MAAGSAGASDVADEIENVSSDSEEQRGAGSSVHKPAVPRFQTQIATRGALGEQGEFPLVSDGPAPRLVPADGKFLTE